MTLYAILGKLTSEAIKNIKGMAERDLKGEQIINASSGKLLEHDYTFGRYDFVAIVELIMLRKKRKDKSEVHERTFEGRPASRISAVA